jgi:hypothetical protein
MVTKKTVDENGHVWSFLSHDKICVTVHKHGTQWVLFVICPAVKAMVVAGGWLDTRAWRSSSDSQLSCEEIVARSADVTLIVNNQLPKGMINLCTSARRKIRRELKNEEHYFMRNLRLRESVGKRKREREMGGICEIPQNPLSIFNSTARRATDGKNLGVHYTG